MAVGVCWNGRPPPDATEEPDGLLSLEPQLVCYSWVTGISEVAHVVFVRQRLSEIQYVRTMISDEQRQEFCHLVEGTVRQIEENLITLRHSCHAGIHG